MDEETKQTAETAQPVKDNQETEVKKDIPAEKEEVTEGPKQETKDVKESKHEKKTREREEIDKLKAKNEVLEQQVAALKNEYAKAYADTENMRKRLIKEHESFTKYHMQDFAKEVLPVLDNCERALAASTNDEAMHKGVEMIYNQLKAALEKEGVTEIKAEGEPFDGNWHQALMSEHKDGVEPGMVIQVLQKGYKLKDRIVRAAMVKVSE